MKSTARILHITKVYGDDYKLQLAKQLKKLRREVKAELLYHIRKGLKQAEQAYSDEIKPGHNIKS